MAQLQQQFRECTEREIRLLMNEGVIQRALLWGVQSSWRVLLDTEHARLILIAEKSRKPRNFAKLDTAAAWLYDLGIRQFGVDMIHFGGLV